MNHAPTKPTTTESTAMNHASIERIASLPAVREAIAAQAAAEEFDALTARMAALATRQNALDDAAENLERLALIDGQLAELDTARRELFEQRAQADQQHQHAAAERRNAERDLLEHHGSRLAVDIARQLQGRASGLRRDAERQRTLIERVPASFGRTRERTPEAAIQLARELDGQAAPLERAAAEIAGLQFAPKSPQEIERTIRDRLHDLGLTLHIAPDIAGWQPAGWGYAPKTVAA